MLLKTIIKLLLASIWIAIINLFTLHSLEFLQNENFFHLGEVAISLTNSGFTLHFMPTKRADEIYSFLKFLPISN